METKKTCTTCFYKSFSRKEFPCTQCTNYGNYVPDTAFEEPKDVWPFPKTYKNYPEPEQKAPTKEETISDYLSRYADVWSTGTEPHKDKYLPLETQVGGGHYKGLKIQPIEYIHSNKLGYCEANIVKYITRWRDKGGKQDLEKIKHYCDLLIQLEGL